MKPILSICIASFNKAETTSKLVKTILTCNREELEVVVVDNASTDNTLFLLNSIKDKRLRVIQNDTNIGYARNLVKSLLSANGDFCFYSNDRDLVFPDKLGAFISFLRENGNIGGGHCVRNLIKDAGQFIGYQGIEALMSINFCGEHPTGYFFRRTLLDAIPKQSLQYYETDGRLFPYENMLCEIICKGYTVVRYNDVIWQSTGNTTHHKYVAASDTSTDYSNKWFSPTKCLERAIGNINDTLRLCSENSIILTNDQKYHLFAQILSPQYTFGVYRFKVIFENPSLAYHYQVPNRKIKSKELRNNKSYIINGFIDDIRKKEGENLQLESIIINKIRLIEKKQSHRRLISFLSGVKHRILNFGKN